MPDYLAARKAAREAKERSGQGQGGRPQATRTQAGGTHRNGMGSESGMLDRLVGKGADQAFMSARIDAPANARTAVLTVPQLAQKRKNHIPFFANGAQIASFRKGKRSTACRPGGNDRRA
jgi:hypothetical protein